MPTNCQGKEKNQKVKSYTREIRAVAKQTVTGYARAKPVKPKGGKHLEGARTLVRFAQQK